MGSSPDLTARPEKDPNAGVDAACDLVIGIRDSGAFDIVHFIPVARATAKSRPGWNGTHLHI